MIANMTFTQLLWYFLIYSFLGWCAEVAFQAVKHGLVTNRGFLNGPVCPIYGVGMVGVLCLLGQFARGGRRESLLLLFLLGMLLATGVELVGGWVLDQLYHTRWWDYSRNPFNFRGYICLEFSLIWGCSILIATDEIHPWIRDHIVQRIPPTAGTVVLGVLYLGFLCDLILTVVVLNRMTRHLRELEELSTRLRTVSDALSTAIGTTTLTAAQRVGESQVQAALGRAELKETVSGKYRSAQRELEEKRAELEQRKAELQQRAEEIYRRMLASRGLGRLLNAFPELESRDHRELMESLKQRWRQVTAAKKDGN